MKYIISLVAASFLILLMTGCQSTLVGTWDSVEITHLQKQESPTATSIRMVMTPQGDSFLILDNDDGSRNIWHSTYSIEDDQLNVQFLFEPETCRFEFVDGNLVVESKEVKVVFKPVK